MSVAVIIDDQTEINVDEEGVITPVAQPWTPEDMTKYRDLVAATVGFTPDRGDTLIVENVSFGNELLPVEPATVLERQAPLILMGLRYVIITVVFFFVYLLFLRPLQKTIFANWEPRNEVRLAPAQLTPAMIQTPLSVNQLEQQMTSKPLPALSGQVAAAAPAAPMTAKEIVAAEPLAPPPPSKLEVTRERIVQQAQQEPEAMARLVRTWLSEEGE